MLKRIVSLVSAAAVAVLCGYSLGDCFVFKPNNSCTTVGTNCPGNYVGPSCTPHMGSPCGSYKVKKGSPNSGYTTGYPGSSGSTAEGWDGQALVPCYQIVLCYPDDNCYCSYASGLPVVTEKNFIGTGTNCTQ